MGGGGGDERCTEPMAFLTLAVCDAAVTARCAGAVGHNTPGFTTHGLHYPPPHPSPPPFPKQNSLLGDGKPGNGGKLGLFLDLYEITPQINRQGNFLVDRNDRPMTQVFIFVFYVFTKDKDNVMEGVCSCLQDACAVVRVCLRHHA